MRWDEEIIIIIMLPDEQLMRNFFLLASYTV